MTAGALENRLKKNLKRLRPWCVREDITCFRAYDRDIPGIPLAIDLYSSVAGEKSAHVSVYEPRHGVSDREVDNFVAEIARATAIERARVFVKRRAPGTAYEKVAETGARQIVMEGGLKFLVNLVDYLDTGLFLDHRRTRARVRSLAAGKRVLNLFSYTGSFSVYAAAGNASQTVSVDLSPTYCRWAEENLALNGCGAAHRVVVDDVLAFLRTPPAGGAFDVVVLDPPSVSKSKRASADLDVQRDHPELIRRALALLAPGGDLFFSTNLTTFTLAPLAGVFVDEITRDTVPPDFTHRPPPHRAFHIRK